MRRLAFEQFIERADVVHNRKYSYSKSEYTNMGTKTLIICPVHGEFYQIPYDHIRGKGCIKCGYVSSGKGQTISNLKKNRHVISDLNVDNKTGVCIICGPVDVSIRHRKGSRFTICGNSIRLQSRTTKRYPAAKAVAKRRGIDFRLTKNEYYNEISKPCHYCQNKLGQATEVAVGLDRLDSSKGYTVDNIVSCCFVCNVIKREIFSPEETKIMVQAVLKFRGLV